MGLKVVKRWLLPEFCFLQFPMVRVDVGLRKQFINYFVFPIFVCAASFNNTKNYNNNNKNDFNSRFHLCQKDIANCRPTHTVYEELI